MQPDPLAAHDASSPVPSGGDPLMRQLRAGEALALQTFYNALSVEAKRLFRPAGWTMSHEVAEAICGEQREAGKRYDLVLESGSRIVGWAFATRLDTPEAHLGIGVARDFTSRGFGRRLMHGLVAHARGRGLRGIKLSHVVGNARAHRLYEACGFATTGTHTGSDGLEYVDMRLTLEA